LFPCVKDIGGKFTAVDTGLLSVSITPLVPKFTTGFLYWWCTSTCEYFSEFSEKIEMTLMLFSGAWGKMIMKKNLQQKNLVTPSF
jgi:hypothetical protein